VLYQLSYLAPKRADILEFQAILSTPLAKRVYSAGATGAGAGGVPGR